MIRILVIGVLLLIPANARAQEEMVPLNATICTKGTADTPTVCWQYTLPRWVVELPWTNRRQQKDALLKGDQPAQPRTAVTEAAPK